MSTENQYALRDAMWLDQQGGHYIRHVDRMTREELHSKSDIAAELGWRDYQIAELARQVSALQTSQDNIINGLGIKGDGPVSNLVVEYVMGLVAENLALKKAIPSPIEVELDNDSMDDVSIAKDVGFNHAISAFWKNIPTTPNTDAFTAELRAQGVDEFANATIAIGEDERNLDIIYAGNQAKLFAANLRAGRKG